MSIFKKVLDRLEQVAVVISVLAFSTMCMMGILQVFFRYVVGSSLYFSEELARYTFIWATFMASAVCLRRGMHAAIEIFVNWMPVRGRKAMLMFAGLCNIAFFALVFIKGTELTVEVRDQLSTAMEISMSYAYAAIPAGGLLLLLFSVEELINQVFPAKGQLNTGGGVPQC